MNTECVVATPLALEIVREDGRITGLQVCRAQGKKTTADPSPEAKQLAEALARYVAGKDPRWPELGLDLSAMTPFRRTVMEALREVPAGTTMTYGELAARIGRPGAARAVGRVMATNPWTLVYPCHRVMGAGGALTGFSAEGGVELKQFLLDLEARK